MADRVPKIAGVVNLGGGDPNYWPGVEKAMGDGKPPSQEALLWLRQQLARLESGPPRQEAIVAASSLGLRGDDNFNAGRAWSSLVEWMAVLANEGILPSERLGEAAIGLHERHERRRGPNLTFEEFVAILNDNASFERLLRDLGVSRSQGPREFAIIGHKRAHEGTKLRLCQPPETLPDKAFLLRFKLDGGEYILTRASGDGSPQLALAFVKRRLGKMVDNPVERRIVMGLAGVSVPSWEGKEQLLTTSGLETFINDSRSLSRLRSIFAVFGLNLPGKFALTGIIRTDASIVGLSIMEPERADALVSRYFRLYFEVLPSGTMRLVPAKGAGALDLAMAYVGKRLKGRRRINPTVERAIVAAAMDTRPAGRGDDASLTSDKLVKTLRSRTGLWSMIIIKDALGETIRGDFSLTGRLTSGGRIVGLGLAEERERERADEESWRDGSRFRLYFQALQNGDYRLKRAGGTAWHRFAIAFIEGRLRRRVSHPVERAMIAGLLGSRSKAGQEAHSLTVQDLGRFIGGKGLYPRINPLYEILAGEPLPKNFVLVGQIAPDGVGIYGFRVVAADREGLPAYFQLHFEHSGDDGLILKKATGEGALDLAVSYVINKSGISRVSALERAVIARLLGVIAKSSDGSNPLSMQDVEAFVRDERALSRLRLIFTALDRTLPENFTLSGKKGGIKGTLSSLDVGGPDTEGAGGFWLRFRQEGNGKIKLTAAGGSGGLDLAIASLEGKLGIKIEHSVERGIIAGLLSTKAVPPRGEEPSKSLTLDDIAVFVRDGRALSRMSKVYEFLAGETLPTEWVLLGGLKSTGVVHGPRIESAVTAADVDQGIKLLFERRGSGSRLILPRGPNPSTRAALAAIYRGTTQGRKPPFWQDARPSTSQRPYVHNRPAYSASENFMAGGAAFLIGDIGSDAAIASMTGDWSRMRNLSAVDVARDFSTLTAGGAAGRLATHFTYGWLANHFPDNPLLKTRMLADRSVPLFLALTLTELVRSGRIDIKQMPINMANVLTASAATRGLMAGGLRFAPKVGHALRLIRAGSAATTPVSGGTTLLGAAAASVVEFTLIKGLTMAEGALYQRYQVGRIKDEMEAVMQSARGILSRYDTRGGRLELGDILDVDVELSRLQVSIAMAYEREKKTILEQARTEIGDLDRQEEIELSQSLSNRGYSINEVRSKYKDLRGKIASEARGKLVKLENSGLVHNLRRLDGFIAYYNAGVKKRLVTFNTALDDLMNG